IRDFHVTGVQTCALPILSQHSEELIFMPGSILERVLQTLLGFDVRTGYEPFDKKTCGVSHRHAAHDMPSRSPARLHESRLKIERSEERRVGKARRARERA